MTAYPAPDRLRLPDRVGLPTLGVDMLQRLRQDILSCRLRPHERLRFQDLKDRYGVNFGPLREALMRLTSEGLVDMESRRGFRVAGVSLLDLADTTNTRIFIEKEVLRQSIRDGDVEWEARLVAAFHRLAAVETDPRCVETHPDWPDLHRKFHDALVAGCSSALLGDIRHTLFDRAQRYRMLSTLSTPHLRSKSDEHRALMESALARDTALALTLVEQHLRNTARLAVKALRGLEADAHDLAGEPFADISQGETA